MALMETLIQSRGSCYLSLHRWRKKSSWTMLSWDIEGIPAGPRRRSRRSCNISGRRNCCHCSLPYPPPTPDHQIQSSRKSADTINNLAPKLTPSKNYVCLSVCLSVCVTNTNLRAQENPIATKFLSCFQDQKQQTWSSNASYKTWEKISNSKITSKLGLVSLHTKHERKLAILKKLANLVLWAFIQNMRVN
jgi:hypothetical protein